MTQVYKVQLSMNQRNLVDSGITFKQGDFGFQVEIEVVDFDVTGVTPQIVWRKPSGAVESTTITVSGNKFTYTMRGTELDTPGIGICDLKLKNSTTQRISTASFRYFVEADTMDGLNQQADSYSDTIAQIIGGYEQQLEDFQSAFTTQEASVAAANASETKVADFYFLKGRKYIFENSSSAGVTLKLRYNDGTYTDPIAMVASGGSHTFECDDDYDGFSVYFSGIGTCTMESADEGAFTVVSEVANDMESLEDAIDISSKSSKIYNAPTFTTGKIINLYGEESSNANYGYMMVNVNPGDVITIYKYNDNTAYIMRIVTAFNQNNTAIALLGSENVYSYTVPNGIKKLAITTYITEYQKFYCLVESSKKTETVTGSSKLSGKTMYSFGDSLVYGHYMAIGMLDEMAWNLGITYTKYAVNGAAVVDPNSSKISTQITNASDAVPDYIVFDGFINDCKDEIVSGSLGSISASYDDANFDTNTFCGAFEHICYLLRNKYLTSNIIYVLTHKTPTRTANSQAVLSEKIHEMCNKWAIPVVDIHNEGQINTNISTMKAEYSYDSLSNFKNGNGTHLNVDGYRKWYRPLIEAQMSKYTS